MQKQRHSRVSVKSARLFTISAMIAATLGVSACVPLAATGFAFGAIAVIDRRTIGAQTEDQGIELKAIVELRKVITDATGIAVTSYNRRVLLTGQVLSGIDKQNAGAVIAGLTNVRGVYNELEIAGKSTLSSDAADTTVTTKVKTVLLRDKVVPGNSIKVKTEQAVVYLMGLVTHLEGQKAAELASQVAGVNRVITVFEILSQEEAERLSNALGGSAVPIPAAQQPVVSQPMPVVPPATSGQPASVAPPAGSTAPAVSGQPGQAQQPNQPVPPAVEQRPAPIQPPLVAPAKTQ